MSTQVLPPTTKKALKVITLALKGEHWQFTDLHRYFDAEPIS